MQIQKKDEDWDQGVLIQIRKGDLQGINLRPYAEKGYKSDILKQIRRAQAVGVDLDLYVREGYDGEQLREVRVAIRQGIDLSAYLEKGFCGAQLRQIRKGLHHFLDVSLYADIRYNWLQMREIRTGLQNRVDASQYANPFFSYGQMKEIRLGLEEGVDITSYADLLYSSMDMKESRKKLILQMYADDCKLQDMTMVDEGSNLEIYLTNNRLEAYIVLPKEHRKQYFTVDSVEQILRRNGIVFGIDRDRIADALQRNQFGEKILAAKGIEPKVGEDGRYEFFFNTEPSRKPVELEDGRLDYQNVDIFEEVEKDQVIVRYIPAQRGESGTGVRGMELPGIKGMELPLLQGSGIRLLEDGITYVATMSGIIEYKKGEIQIFESLVIKEDVNSSYGNIYFRGCVHIYGNVGSNVEIHAEGGVSIEGNVEAADISSYGDVLIKNGMAGAGRGRIKSSGNIAGNFFEAVNLNAGNNIEAGYLMNSETVAGQKVVIMGRKGAIIGGKTRGTYGIEANYIGNRSQLLTEVAIGASQEMMELLQECQERLEEVQSALVSVSTQMSQFSDEEKKSIVYRKKLAEQLTLKNQAEQILNERRRMQDILMANSSINVLSRAYAGTRIVMNQTVKDLDHDYKMTTFCLEDKEIVNK